TTTCSVDVRQRLSAPLTADRQPCLTGNNDSLLDLIDAQTGDGTPIACDFAGGSGNGRLPTGVTIDPETCTLVGSIDETRYGTWVFTMRGTQNGSEVFVPYCVTNDQQDGYVIGGSHSGSMDNELEPLFFRYDPNEPWSFGQDDDPRYEVFAPAPCVGTCFFQYSFFRSSAPIDDNFTLEPDGLVQNDGGETVGFFHELRVSGGVNADFAERPWVLAITVNSCITDQTGGCADIKAEGDGAFEFGLVMVPDAG
nr:putative Ig domain-containing protein [Deltaproteobacteria bacterium]